MSEGGRGPVLGVGGRRSGVGYGVSQGMVVN